MRTLIAAGAFAALAFLTVNSARADMAFSEVVCRATKGHDDASVQALDCVARDDGIDLVVNLQGGWGAKHFCDALLEAIITKSHPNIFSIDLVVNNTGQHTYCSHTE
jgi:hypothetical protein